MPSAIVCDGDRSQQERRRHSAGELRCERLGLSPQYRPVEAIGAGGHGNALCGPNLGKLLYERTVAVPASVGALSLYRRQEVSARDSLPGDEGGRRILSELAGRGQRRTSDHMPFVFDGEQLFCSERKARKRQYGMHF